jgi:hypothetical protein
MPWWAWLFYVAALIWFPWRVQRTLRTGVFSYGPFKYPRDESPILFWTLTGVDSLCALFVAVMLVLIVKNQFFST